MKTYQIKTHTYSVLPSSPILNILEDFAKPTFRTHKAALEFLCSMYVSCSNLYGKDAVVSFDGVLLSIIKKGSVYTYHIVEK